MSEVKTPVSPKVNASTAVGAATVLALYLLAQLSFVGSLPNEVKGALLVLITAGLTWFAGWWKTDPLRNLGKQAEIQGSAKKPSYKPGEYGRVNVYYVAAVLVIVVAVIWLLTWLLGRV